MKETRMYASAIAAGCLILAACGGGGGGGGGNSTLPSPPVPSGTVSGTAAKGLLLNAIVSFYPVTNGVEGTAAITSVRTDSETGAFSTTVSSAGAVVVTVTVDSTTQMLDEISGSAIAAPSGLVLHAVFDNVTNLQPIAVTPLTEMAYDVAKSSGSLTTANIDAANNAVSTAFLAGAPALYTQPIDIKTYASATAAQQEQAKFLVALAVAANEGIATGSSSAPCAATYSANIVCLVGGLGNLLSLSSSGAITLGSAGTYISAAYRSIDSGAVAIDGGQAPSALGLNVTTAAETSFLAAIAQQAPLPGYNPGADPLTNTKALFANIRQNILDQATTQTFGYAPTLTSLTNDYETNVHPVVANTVSMLVGAYEAVQLIQQGTTSTTGFGVPTAVITNPTAMAADAAGNLYVVNSDETIAKVTGSSATVYAGQAGVIGSTNGPAAQASFTNITAIATDSMGNVYVADYGTIREISTTGMVSTLAGQPGVFGDADQPGAAASFQNPAGLAVDASRNVYVADPGNGAVRLVTSAGVVSTLAVQPNNACPGIPNCLYSMGGIALDNTGNIYVTEPGWSIVQKITPDGTATTLAGQFDMYGYNDGAGIVAEFSYPTAIAIDAFGNLYVADTNNSAVREITPAGVVSTLAKSDAHTTAASAFGYLTGITIDSTGNAYVANDNRSSIQEVSPSGTVTTLIHNLVSYQDSCGYDPVGLGTANNVALCRYGLTNNPILLTVTQTGTGTYTLQTQALGVADNWDSCASFYSPLCGYAVVSSIAPLHSAFTWTVSGTGADSSTFSGPYYVNASGGQVQGSFSAAESSDWNSGTDTGTITLGGSLSGGSGGVSLVSATIGSDSAISIQNGFRLLADPIAPIARSGAPAITITGTLDLTEYQTSAFSYAVKATLGAPIQDKSATLAPPGTISVTGSIAQISANGTIPLFSGTVSASLEGLPSFDALQPVSATNYFTAQAMFDGTLSLPGGRLLTVNATANASQIVPTPALPDSATATYSYSTPSGTAQLNASGQYDATNGYAGTITNNAGVVISVTDPIGGKLAGTVTANGIATATINGAFIYYSDGTSESLF